MSMLLTNFVCFQIDCLNLFSTLGPSYHPVGIVLAIVGVEVCRKVQLSVQGRSYPEIGSSFRSFFERVKNCDIELLKKYQEIDHELFG